MKKIIAILLSLAMVLSLCACQKSAVSEPSASDTSVEQSVADSSVASDTADSSADSSVQTTQPVETEPASDGGVPVITLEHTEGEETADDGTVVMAYSTDKVTVSIPGNEEAQAAMQADLDALVQDFVQAVDEQAQEALVIYEQYYTGDSSSEIQEYMYSYCDDLSVTIARCDEQVISLVIDEVGYAGGAHGWDNRYTRNYDVQTGQRLTFEDLGGDTFVSRAKELVLEQAATMEEEEERFFEGYETYIDAVIQDGTSTAEDVYGEGMGDAIIQPTFYFNDEGVVFISGEYVLQPYAGGIVEFTIHYGDLADVLPEAYAK